MTENINIRSLTPATESTIRDFTKRGIEVQSELSQKLAEATRHWLEEAQLASAEGWELFWKIQTAPSIPERIQACQTWVRRATERASADTNYLLETARALSEIELKLINRASDEVRENTPKRPDA
jgi:hypothetical protein